MEKMKVQAACWEVERQMYKFHPEHTWIKMDGPECVIGLTYFAQAHLGEIVYVDILKEGTMISADKAMAGIESAKTTSEIIAPVSGRVLAANKELTLTPTLINDSPMELGWIVRIEPASSEEFDRLMELKAYEDYLSSLPPQDEAAEND